jgi:hypothetical protein
MATDRVVDTNVAIIANRTDEWPPECATACIDTVIEVTHGGGLVLDSLGLIVEEYLRYLDLSGEPGPGDAFMRWVFDNEYRTDLCTRVLITEDEDRGFVEFPEDDGLATFDRSDRKFVATAVSHGSAEIVVGTDSDWWDHREASAEMGMKIQFLCEKYFREREAADKR